MMREEPITIYGGEQILDFIWIDTVVKAFIAAGYSSLPTGTPINIGSASSLSIIDLAKRMKSVCKSKTALEIIPAREIEVSRFCADISRAKEYLDLEPPAEPLQHLEEMLLFYKEQEAKH